MVVWHRLLAAGLQHGYARKTIEMTAWFRSEVLRRTVERALKSNTEPYGLEQESGPYVLSLFDDEVQRKRIERDRKRNRGSHWLEHESGDYVLSLLDRV
jgi:hypothetical protein